MFRDKPVFLDRELLQVTAGTVKSCNVFGGRLEYLAPGYNRGAIIFNVELLARGIKIRGSQLARDG